ncbi:MAG: GEVED domain-containing protein [Thermoanaerobaculia bacterium]
MLSSRIDRSIAVALALAVGLAVSAQALQPVQIKDLEILGSGDSDPCGFTTLGGEAIFAATDNRGRELWKTDGSWLGTQRIKDIWASGTQSSSPHGFFPFDSPALGPIVLFVANDGSHGNELWRTDGTSAGTQRITDVSPGTGHSNPSSITVPTAGGDAFFLAFNPAVGTEIWRTDGSTASVVVGGVPGGLIAGQILTSLGGDLYFDGFEPASNVGVELWKVDLPSGTPSLVTDIESGPDGSYPLGLTSIGGQLYFSAFTNATGREPYVSDGSTTTLLGDLTTTGSGNTQPYSFAGLGSWVLFLGQQGLLRTDGTPGGTSVLLSGVSPAGNLIASGSRLYFAATAAGVGLELHVTDGTTAGLVENIDGGPGQSVPFQFEAVDVDGTLVFAADDGVHGMELWSSTDGTAGGTDLLYDLEPGAGSSTPSCFARAAGLTLLGATQAPWDHQLYALADPALDFGDAPDSYFTKLAADGPRHALGSGLTLGTEVDGELDRPFDISAQADDLTWFADEDGVAFAATSSSFGLLGIGETGQVTVTASAAGELDAWIDFNGDGDFGDSGEKLVFTDGGGSSLAAGANVKTFAVPTSATPGISYARFRLTSAGIASPIGLAPDGEVEDYGVILAAVDFGDAPDAGFATLRGSDGARHALLGPFLGAQVDAETDGQPTAGATGDDFDGTDDEDGVSVPALPPGQIVDVTVEVSFQEEAPEGGGGTAFLNAWFDFDRDGDWDGVDEHPFQDVALSAGTNVLQLAVPAGASEGTALARFRVASTTGLGSTGFAFDGEVEDHAVEIGLDEADLSVVKDDGQTTAVPGGQVTYVVTAANATGPDPAVGARVVDAFPSQLHSCTTDCVAAGGAACTVDSEAEGEGMGGAGIDQLVSLPVGGSVTFTTTCTIDADATGTLENTATVEPPLGVMDPVGGNDSAIDVDTLEPTGDLSITKTDGVPWVIPPATLTYTIQASNPGPSDAVGVQIEDPFPAEVTNVQWACVGADGGTCAASGSGDIDELVDLPAGAAVTFPATADTDGDPGESAVNTATLTPPVGFTDPSPGNDSATDVTHYVDGLEIFMDGFESGDTSAWDVAVGGAAPVILLPEAVAVWEETLHLDATALERSGRRSTRLVSGRSEDGAALFEVVLETERGRYRLRPRARTESGTWIEGEARRLDAVPERLGLSWRGALGKGVADGRLLLSVDGTFIGLLEGVADAGGSLRRVQIHGVREVGRRRRDRRGRVAVWWGRGLGGWSLRVPPAPGPVEVCGAWELRSLPRSRRQGGPDGKSEPVLFFSALPPWSSRPE